MENEIMSKLIEKLTVDIFKSEVVRGNLCDGLQIGIDYKNHYQDCFMTDKFHELFTVTSTHHRKEGVNVRFEMRKDTFIGILAEQVKKE